MQVRVCGCSGGETPETALTGFLVDGELALDAGSLCRSLTLEEQCRIDNVLITHTHLDHIKDLAFLADNVIGIRQGPINIWGSDAVISTLKSHLMNNHIWPDFSRIPTPEAPIVVYHAIHPEKPFRVSRYDVLAVSTQHPVPNTAYILTRDSARCV